MIKNYYIADCHFCHENVIKFDNRPFNNAEEMDKIMIDNWNAVVHKKDNVYILGDFVWKNKDKWKEITSALKGNKYLIIGNHDPKNYPDDIKKLFVEITNYKEINDLGKRVILCHYPIIFHNKDYLENCYMLYGHVHVTREYDYLKEIRKEIIKRSDIDMSCPLGNFINVGCMMPYINYTPKTLEEIILQEKKY